MKLAPESFKSDLAKLANAQFGPAHGHSFMHATSKEIYLSPSQI
jgi:hypothetical protein